MNSFHWYSGSVCKVIKDSLITDVSITPLQEDKSLKSERGKLIIWEVNKTIRNTSRIVTERNGLFLVQPTFTERGHFSVSHINRERRVCMSGKRWRPVNWNLTFV